MGHGSLFRLSCLLFATAKARSSKGSRGLGQALSISPIPSLTQRKLFCELGSDGITRDSAGNIYLTGKDGNKLGEIPVPKPWTANITFGGPDLKTLFITASDSVFTMEVAVSGTR